MADNLIQRVKTITEFHRLRGLPKPEHPLISVVNYVDIDYSTYTKDVSWVNDFYSISLKRNCGVKMKYGQQQYDFDEGVLAFISPNQVFKIQADQRSLSKMEGWLLLVHPDFLWHTPLANTIKQYAYFDYAVHEALFVSDKEETTINQVIQNIRQEYHSNIDKYSHAIIISQIETLLNYAERFYQRQFITRKINNHQILDRFEKFLGDYFNSEELALKGLPTVEYTAEALHVSQSYLSSLLKLLTGQSTQQHIHNKLIQKAKEKLSTTDLSASEIAYELGFEHPQSFSKLFKSKTNLSPLEFRQSFN